MKTAKKICKQLIFIGAAAACAFLLVNLLLLPYYHYTPGIPMDVNATKEIYYPDTEFNTLGEGFSIGRFDKNGYLNDVSDDELENYVLIMGSSHAMGKEVPGGFSFGELLNKEYGIPTYNIAMDGHFFTDNVAGFSAALEQFQRSDAIVIETSLTKFDLDELKGCLTQRPYDVNSTGPAVVEGMGTVARVKSVLKTWFPFRILLTQKINALKATTRECNTGTYDQYKEAVDDVMKLIKEKYDKPVIILYHPTITVDKEGKASAVADDEETKRAFTEACAGNGIIFADMSDMFLKEYENEHVLPHGFMNTSPGTGHLNRTGHRLIAAKLAEIIGTIE